MNVYEQYLNWIKQCDLPLYHLFMTNDVIKITTNNAKQVHELQSEGLVYYKHDSVYLTTVGKCARDLHKGQLCK